MKINDIFYNLLILIVLPVLIFFAYPSIMKTINDLTRSETVEERDSGAFRMNNTNYQEYLSRIERAINVLSRENEEMKNNLQSIESILVRIEIKNENQLEEIILNKNLIFKKIEEIENKNDEQFESLFSDYSKIAQRQTDIFSLVEDLKRLASEMNEVAENVNVKVNEIKEKK